VKTKKKTRDLPVLIPPKLLRDVLLDDGHGVYSLLILCCGVHFVVSAEVGDVFGVGEIFFSGV